jgi:acetylornithine/N-succinyldiaminopimelate aminotransferase
MTNHLLDVYAQLPFEPVSAKGSHLLTAEGRWILDLYGGHAVASLGYAHPRVVDALARQAKELTFQTNAVPLKIRERAAARLVSIAPEGLNRVFFVNSGAEANENALRLALLGSKRKKVVAVEHGFHGRTAAAGAVTWGSDRWYAFPEKPFQVSFIPQNVADGLFAIDADTAAVIVEPVQGMAGALDLDAAFLKALRERCDETGALLIFDEVQCGVGRTGYGFAAEQVDVLPDILTTAKSVAAGFPVGVVLMTDAVARRARRGSLGTTFGGGPMACALVETVIDVIEEEGLLQHVRNVSSLIRSTCVVGPIIKIQGSGFLLGLVCQFNASIVRDDLLSRDILVGTSSDPKVLRLMPPLNLAEKHVGDLARALASCAASTT